MGAMSAPTSPRPPHVIEMPTLRPRRGVPEGWLRGLVAGTESASFSALALVIPAVATYVATAAAPALGEASWQSAARIGAHLWLLGHGAPVAGGATVSLVPLGATLLSVALVHVATRRMRLRSVGAAAFVPAGYLAVVAVALALAPGSSVWRALLGGLGVAVLGTVTAQARAAVPPPAWWHRWAGRVPEPVRAGLRAASWTGAGLLLGALLALAAAVVAGWDRILLIHDAYGTDPVSGVVMALAQLLYVPTGLVWALAWVAGPGFAVGAGTQFTATTVVTAPLPAIPLLGALPSPGTPGMGWAAFLPVVVALGVGVWLDRRHRQTTLPRAVASALTAAVAVAVVAVGLCVAASGAIGAGRMAEVGPGPWTVGAMLLAEVAAGTVLAVTALHPRTHDAVRTLAGTAREKVRGAVADRRRTEAPGATPATSPAASARAGAGEADAPATAGPATARPVPATEPAPPTETPE